MSRCLLDTNILLRNVDAAHPHHPPARAALRELTARGTALCITPQNLIEYWAVATRPPAANGLGLAPVQAAGDIANFKVAFELLPDVPAIFGEWERITVAYGVVGKQSHDARLVAVMKAHGIAEILTFNADDFQRYAVGEGIAIVDPHSVVAPSTTA